MSLPKEPRQKMINMMYLVLTALLALNVSTEVLNAFTTVNNSLQNSNTVVSQKNNLTYKAFNDALNDEKTKEQAKIWGTPALQIQSSAGSFSTYIENLKLALKRESGLKMVDGKEDYTIGDLDAATRMFDQGGHGKKLYDSLRDFRNQLLSLIDPNNPIYADAKLTDSAKADMQRAEAEFRARLPINLSVPKSETGEADKKDTAENWTIRYFHMTPTVAALTILSKFESDVKNSESQVIDYLHSKIGEVKIRYDKQAPLVSPSATYVMPGDEMKITAGIGAFSSTAKPTITFDGVTAAVGDDGTAVNTFKVSGSGPKQVTVHIKYFKPDGSVGDANEVVKYDVGVPSGASMFLEKMNVVYIAVDNPVTISGGSVGAEKVHVSFDKGTITKTSGDEYNIVPTTAGEGKIIIDAAGKPYPFTLRVKYLPNPTGFVGNHTGGVVSSAEFKADGGVLAKLESDFQAGFTVIDYKLAATINGQYMEAPNDGPRWTGQAQALVNRCTPGTHVFIDELRCKGKDGKVRTLPSMIFTLN
ncbi:MAG TPA: GldM family protein [Puia sp.]|nr:GldM family protein [Puia sp.]